MSENSVTRIESFPHLEITPDDIKQMETRKNDDDDLYYNEGKAWARDEGLDAPAPWLGGELHQDYLQVHKTIREEARARYPNDVVAENAFADGAKAWAGA